MRRASPASPRWVVVSGLPGSGKSTLARDVSAALGWTRVDKDDELESLFEAALPADLHQRHQLSREADRRLAAAADTAACAVLVSWWRHPGSPDAGGTSLAVVPGGPGQAIELHCRCEPLTAAARFFARRRHPGHRDAQRDRADTLAMFMRQAALGPLWPARAIVVDTNEPVVGDALSALVAQL